MSEDIDSERKKLYEKSAEYLELFVKNIPNNAHKIFEKINVYVREDYLTEIKELLGEAAKEGKGITIQTDDFMELFKKFKTDKNKSN